MNTESYDLEKVYDQEITPHMAAILEVCKRENLPMIAMFQYKSEVENDAFEFSTSAMIQDDKRPISDEINAVWSIFERINRKLQLRMTVRNAQRNSVEITEVHE